MMTKKHPRWSEFCDYLFGPDGIDLHVKGEGICT
jgi:hypothetical protein